MVLVVLKVLLWQLPVPVLVRPDIGLIVAVGIVLYVLIPNLAHRASILANRCSEFCWRDSMML